MMLIKNVVRKIFKGLILTDCSWYTTWHMSSVLQSALSASATILRQELRLITFSSRCSPSRRGSLDVRGTWAKSYVNTSLPEIYAHLHLVSTVLIFTGRKQCFKLQGGNIPEDWPPLNEMHQ